MDSLQALMFIRNLKRVFNLPQLVVNDIYSNPSLISLARVLQHSLKQEEDVSPPLIAEETRVKNIEHLLTEYCGLIDRIPPLEYTPVSLPEIKSGSILLTGSTGGLDRVTFLSADLSKSKLGLGDEVYNDLLQNVTQIIHNAWPVNFHINLSSYHTNLLGVVNLAKFASEASRSPPFLYISSVSAVSSFTSVDDSVSRIPKAIIHDASASESMGSGESKYLSERILDYASKKIQLQVNIARVGQISGPIQGPSVWSRDEWFPSLTISSSFVALPSSSSAKTEIKRISFESWIQKVEETADQQSSHSTEDANTKETHFDRLVELNPAIKLTHFYRTEERRKEGKEWETGRAQMQSENLRNLGKVENIWLEKWIKAWMNNNSNKA
ncbi:hypothetical protein BCON_0287g00150 [Botryotinia convoluta]|uniref:Thioester reductase (TE) domain-containing protein n=1 Tax=Botryotinia convoluta TaxID=54673 RepID=A0A4Z1HER3_9HELO|nr:hypothetical protein BCON_0287g00150 [Botryotinia convoluta]